MDTKEDTDVKTAPEAPAMPAPVVSGPGELLQNLALYLGCPYMGQWTWLTIRWRDCNQPSGPCQSRRWTPTL